MYESKWTTYFLNSYVAHWELPSDTHMHKTGLIVLSLSDPKQFLLSKIYCSNTVVQCFFNSRPPHDKDNIMFYIYKASLKLLFGPWRYKTAVCECIFKIYGRYLTLKLFLCVNTDTVGGLNAKTWMSGGLLQCITYAGVSSGYFWYL